MDSPVETADPAARQGTLASSVYEKLREDVLFGVFAPGEKLRIEALRERYSVGASPVREALNRLVSEGLVVLEDQKGFRVPPISLDDLNELTRTGCLINEIALRESISRGDEAWEERVVVAYHRWQRGHRNDIGQVAVTRLHREFHSSLISACGSHWLIGFAELLFNSALRYRALAYYSRELEDFDTEHRAIMDAVLARDFELAVRLNNEHDQRTADVVAKILSERAE